MLFINKNYLILLLLLLSFFVTSSSYAQTVYCNYCGKTIEGTFIKVDGKAFHPDHFLCYKCKKPIEGNYYKHGKNYFHSECYAETAGYVCDVCKKVIEGEYYEKNSKKYHPSCFTDFKADKCAVCTNPILDEYFSDIYGNKFHKKHEYELEKCDNCHRLICQSITDGGVKYEDGRSICNLCYRNSKNRLSDYKLTLKKVNTKLNEIGISINLSGISIKNVNRNELKEIAGSSYNSSMRGYCESMTYKIKTGNGIKSKKGDYKIYVLNKIPADDIESIIAHELMHVWIYQNTNKKHSPELEEGACNYISYTYLKRLYNSLVEPLIKQLMTDPDPVYGEGFRKVKKKFEFKPISRLLEYLKSNSNL